MIPNMILDDERIDAATMRVYIHIRRVAGEEGVFWRGVREICRACRLSPETVTKAKRDLATAGYITITTERRRTDGRLSEHIRIVDVWQTNADRYRNRTDEGSNVTETERYRAELETDALPKPNATVTPSGTTKKNPTNNLEKNQKEEPIGDVLLPQQSPPPPAKGKPPRVETWGTYETQDAYLSWALTEYGPQLGRLEVEVALSRCVDNHRKNKYTGPLDKACTVWLNKDVARLPTPRQNGAQRNGTAYRTPQPATLPGADGRSQRTPIYGSS